MIIINCSLTFEHQPTYVYIHSDASWQIAVSYYTMEILWKIDPVEVMDCLAGNLNGRSLFSDAGLMAQQ